MKRITLPNGQLSGLDAEFGKFLCYSFHHDCYAYEAQKNTEFQKIVNDVVEICKFSRPSATHLVALYPIKSKGSETVALFIYAHRQLRCFDILSFIQNDKL